MVIAVNIRSLPGNEAWNALVEETLLRLAARHPRMQLVFITDHLKVPVPDMRNVRYHRLPKPAHSPLAIAWWYNLRLPPLLRSFRADLVLQCTGITTQRTGIPQCLLLHDVHSLQQQGWLPKTYQRFMRKSLPGFLRTAALVLTTGQPSMNIAQQYLPVEAGKIKSWLPMPAPLKAPADAESREAVKNQYAGGYEYFVCQAAVHPRNRLLLLLKAFSLFKKRMKSGMRLVIITGPLPAKDAWVDSLRLYKYRSELQLVQDPAEAEHIVAAAYACIQLSPLPADIIRSQACWSAGVPVITTDEEPAHELMGNAALFIGTDDPAELAAQMMAVYRDENLYRQVAAAGRQSWQESIGANSDEQLYTFLRSLQKA